MNLVKSTVGCLAIVFAASLALACGPAHAERRLALVIGNGKYVNAPQLRNPANDATAIAAALEKLGFEVVSGVDLDLSGMNRTLKEFSRKLAGTDVGLFFYSGHGLQVNGENYLVPIDAGLKQEADLDFEAVKVSTVLDQLLRDARIKIVMLDACRDNPLAETLARSMKGSTRSLSTGSGLAAIDVKAAGTVIAFATSPGNVALDGKDANSPFTTAVLENIATPGIDIEIMMKRVKGRVAMLTKDKQQPWTNSSLNAEFQLVTPPTGASATPAANQSASLTPSGTAASANTGAGADAMVQVEIALWQSAEKDNNEASYSLYLERFPQGQFAALAKQRLDTIHLANPPKLQVASEAVAKLRADEKTEKKMSLSDVQYGEVQAMLSLLGFGTRSLDGHFGFASRNALKSWQTQVGLEPTGYLNAEQVALLKSDGDERYRTWQSRGKPPITSSLSTSNAPDAGVGGDVSTQHAVPTGKASHNKVVYARPPKVRGNAGGGNLAHGAGGAAKALGSILRCVAGIC